MKHTFLEPFTFEGKEYKELEFDFKRLTGNDVKAVERELAASGIMMVYMATSQTAQMLIAAKAAKVPSELIDSLPADEVIAIAMLAQSFLLRVG